MNSPAYANPGLWHSVWKLLWLRLVISMRSFRRARTRSKIGIIILGILIISLVSMAFVGSWVVIRFMRSPELAAFLGEISPLVEAIPILIVTGVFMGMLLTSFGVLLQAMYLAGDMEFLLSTPLPMRAVFIAKMLQAILPNFALICLFALPIMYGLGAAGNYNFLYYPLVILILAALALAAAGAAGVFVMLIVRIIPARRVAEVLGFFGAVMSILCSQSGQLANFGEVSSDQAAMAMNMAARADVDWSPLAWAGRSLVYIGESNWLPGIGLLIVSLGLCAAFFAVALVAAERLYYTGWATMQVNKRIKKTTRQNKDQSKSPQATLLFKTSLLIPASLRSIVVKDFLVLRRDLRNLSQLVTPLIFGVIYAFLLIRNDNGFPEGAGEAPDWFMQTMNSAFVYVNVGLSLFVSWMLLGRLAGMSFSQEGRSYWLLKIAPVSSNRLISAKFLVAFLPSVALSWAFLLIISLIQQASLSVVLFGLIVVVLSIIGNAGINMAFGILGANMAWEDPRQMQRATYGCLGAAVTIIFLPVTLILFFGPAIGFGFLGLPQIYGQVIGIILGGSVSVASGVVALLLVRSRVERLGEA